MLYKSLLGDEQIPTLGLGTWDIGGGMTANRRHDKEFISALRTAIEMGYTHIDTAELYGAGHTEELLGRVIKDFDRKSLFITTKVSPSNLRYQSVMKAIEGSLNRLAIDYVDLYLIHWYNDRIPLEETFQAFNELVDAGKIRYLGVSNFNLDQMWKAQAMSGTPIVTNQVPYSLRSRGYVRNGVLEYCQENGILITAYSPIKGVNLREPFLREIAKKYSATPAQIALSWLVQQPAVITIPKSSNQDRLKENLESLDLRISPEDFARLDRLTA